MKKKHIPKKLFIVLKHKKYDKIVRVVIGIRSLMNEDLFFIHFYDRRGEVIGDYNNLTRKFLNTA